jgi:hypothetical protein
MSDRTWGAEVSSYYGAKPIGPGVWTDVNANFDFVKLQPRRGWVMEPPPLPIRQISTLGSKQMKASTKDQIKGKFHEVKGKVKEKAGQVIQPESRSPPAATSARKHRRYSAGVSPFESFP